MAHDHVAGARRAPGQPVGRRGRGRRRGIASPRVVGGVEQRDELRCRDGVAPGTGVRISGRVREVVRGPRGMLDGPCDDPVVSACEHRVVVERHHVVCRVEPAARIDEPVRQRPSVRRVGRVGVDLTERRRDDEYEQLLGVQLGVLEEVEVDPFGVADGEIARPGPSQRVGADRGDCIGRRATHVAVGEARL